MSEPSAAEILLRARISSQLTQRALAERAGIPQSAVSNYEGGRTEPSLPVLRRLVAAAGFRMETSLVELPRDVSRPFTGPVGRRLQRKRRELRDLLADQGFVRPQVFGSVARGQDRPDSDVDLLVGVPASIGLFGLAAAQSSIEQLLGAVVDLIPRDGLKASIAAAIEPDLVAL